MTSLYIAVFRHFSPFWTHHGNLPSASNSAVACLSGQEEKVTEQKPAFFWAAPRIWNLTQDQEHEACPRVALDKQSVGMSPQAGLGLKAHGNSVSQALSPEPLGKARCPRELGREVQAPLCRANTAPPKQRCRKIPLSLLVPNSTVKLAIPGRSGGAQCRRV